MGTALVQAVSQRDYPTVQALIFLMALVFLIVNLAVDLLYARLDPASTTPSKLGGEGWPPSEAFPQGPLRRQSRRSKSVHHVA